MKNKMQEIKKYFNLDKVTENIRASFAEDNYRDVLLKIVDANSWDIDDDEYLTLTFAVALKGIQNLPVRILGEVKVTTPKDKTEIYIYEYHRADNMTA